jgi:hypothetical protein
LALIGWSEILWHEIREQVVMKSMEVEEVLGMVIMRVVEKGTLDLAVMVVAIMEKPLTRMRKKKKMMKMMMMMKKKKKRKMKTSTVAHSQWGWQL